MVRATLIKQIRDFYDFREETDSEAAWQALVLDPSIKLVVCSLSLPVWNRDDLLARVRASSLPRLANMPMLMIAGDNTEMLERAKSLGASGFIHRKSVGEDFLARVNDLLNLPARLKEVEAESPPNTEKADFQPFTSTFLAPPVEQAIAHAQSDRSDVNVLLMAFDGIEELRTRYGSDAVEQLERRFIGMLSGMVRQEDRLVRHDSGQLAIVSPGTPRHACESFSNRLRGVIRKAKIGIQGDPLNLSLSIGISSFPQDRVDAPKALLDLALTRLKAAQQAGGDCVLVSDADRAEAPVPTIEEALDWIEQGNVRELEPYLPLLGYRLLPLLKLLERELKLGLAVAGAEKKLQMLTQDGKPSGAWKSSKVGKESA